MVPDTLNALAWLRKHIDGEGGNDVIREMVKTFAEELMSADADNVCGAAWGERSPERVNSRNGYRMRGFDTRAGSIELAVPRLRSGSYFPDWLLEPRRRAEKALVAVVAEAYVAGVSTRRVDGLVQSMGIDGISKSQVSEMARSLDAGVEAFRSRPLDAGPYTYVAIDALTQKVREGGQKSAWARPSRRAAVTGREAKRTGGGRPARRWLTPKVKSRPCDSAVGTVWAVTTDQAVPDSDSENDECRDVYAFFGLAMFYAQVIEEALAALIAISQYPLTKAQANQIMDRLDACTLGTLLREVRKHLSFEASLETTFQRALKRRNYLAHRFFRDHAIDFMTGSGRRRMLDELTDATECFQDLNTHMLAITLVVGRPIGLTQEFIDRSIVEMLKEGDGEDWEG